MLRGLLGTCYRLIRCLLPFCSMLSTQSLLVYVCNMLILPVVTLRCSDALFRETTAQPSGPSPNMTPTIFGGIVML